MKIKERLAELQVEVEERMEEARDLMMLYKQGHRDTDLKLPDNVIPFPAHRTIQ